MSSSGGAVRCPDCGGAMVGGGGAWHCPRCSPRPDDDPAAGDDRLRVFLSYGHDGNVELVLRIKGFLEARGHEVWIDKDEIKGGDDWRRAIHDGIAASDQVRRCYRSTQCATRGCAWTRSRSHCRCAAGTSPRCW